MSGEEIARELSIRYDGMQKDIGMQFTDVHQTGTTFYANTLEEARAKLAEKRELFKRHENPDTATGTCYEDAWRFLIREEEGSLVHGTVLSLGKRIGHAWVELPTGWVWEPESRQFIKKADFQAMAKPQEGARYSVTEAAVMLARVGKHGPWTEQEKEQFLKKGNPIPKAVVRYKRNYGAGKSVFFVEYEHGGERYITGTVVRGTDRSLGWYFGKGAEGLKEANRIALLSDEEFSKAEDLKRYSWKATLKSISEPKPLAVEEVKPEDNPTSLANDLMPMSLTEGPPLPKGLGLKWPWRK